MAVNYCALLDEARTAYNNLRMGKAVVEFEDQNGERVRYNATNIDKLREWIKELEDLCNPGLRTYRKPIGFLF